MAAKNNRGQALIELVVIAFALVTFFMLAFELSQSAIQVQSKSRFNSSRSTK